MNGYRINDACVRLLSWCRDFVLEAWAGGHGGRIRWLRSSQSRVHARPKAITADEINIFERQMADRMIEKFNGPSPFYAVWQREKDLLIRDIAAREEAELMNTDPLKSAQPCGCDEGANHKCTWHKEESMREVRDMAADLPYAVAAKDAVAQVDAMIGIGGAPTRATTLPTDAAGRKRHPVASGVLDYFPDAIVAVSNISWQGNEQHNPGQPLHWARGKSMDEADTMMRHFLQRGTLDTDGMRHSAKMVWRALALLQKEIEAERKQS